MANIDYLKSSLLFNSVLKGEEIRFSDLLSYLINEFKFTSFISKSRLPEDITSYREVSHFDILIRHTGHDFNQIPIVIIENKLQSLTDLEQLQKYSNSFCKMFIDECKQYIMREETRQRKEQANGSDYKECKRTNLLLWNTYKPTIKKLLRSLKFIVLLPNKSNEKIHPIKCPFLLYTQKEKFEIECKWKIITYSKIGEKLNEFVNAKQYRKSLQKQSTSDFFKEFFISSYLLDFANVLSSFQDLKIKPVYPKRTFSKNYLDSKIYKTVNLDSLYEKLKAANFAKKLLEYFENKPLHNRYRLKGICVNWTSDLARKADETNSSKSLYSFRVNDIWISHDFSAKGKNGLFEVVRKISKSDYYILQIEDQKLKKAIITLEENSKNYKSFLEAEWSTTKLKPLKFQTPKQKLKEFYSYKSFDGKKFWFTYCEVESMQVEDIFDTLFNKIQLNRNDIQKFE